MRLYKINFADREMKKRNGLIEYYYTVQCFSKLPQNTSYALFRQESFNKSHHNAYENAVEFMLKQMKTYKN
jgi:hypothetical protein